MLIEQLYIAASKLLQIPPPYRYFLPRDVFFTARCYAERGYVTVGLYCLSVRL